MYARAAQVNNFCEVGLERVEIGSIRLELAGGAAVPLAAILPAALMHMRGVDWSEHDLL